MFDAALSKGNIRLKNKIEKLKKEKKILVVEDSPTTLNIIVNYLKIDGGYHVISARDGEEGLEIFKKEKNNIALVLTDWIMPRMSGYELCQAIRKEETDFYVYIIFLSIVEEKDKVVSSLISGADDYLVKPFHAKELLARVEVGFRIVALESAYKEALKEREFILASLSHKVRNYLNSMIGYFQLIRMQHLDDKMKKYFLHVFTAAKNLEFLLNNFFDIIKLRAGEYEIVEKEFVLKDIKENILKQFKWYLKDTIVLKVNISEELDTVYIGDNRIIERIFLCIILFFLKFIEKGEIEIGLKEKKALKDCENLVFYVKAKGVNISEKELEQSLDRCILNLSGMENFVENKCFINFDLSIAYVLASIVKGKLWWKKENKDVITFYFKVNLKKREKKNQDTPSISNLKVLIGEDLPSNQLLLKNMLVKFFGIKEIDLANNGKEVVELATKNNYDIILLDVRMPEMDGIEATKILREKGVKTPIYIVTGDVYKTTMMEAISAGANGFLGKPITKEDLERVLKSIKGEIDVTP